MLPYINTSQTFNQNGFTNGSPRSNSRRLRKSNENLNLNNFCSCGSEYGEPCVCGPRILSPSNSKSILPTGIAGPINPFPNFNPDPSLINMVNVEIEAFKLALHTLKISQAQYNSMKIEDLKRFPNTIPESYAVNILIESKKKSQMNISPIKRHSNFANEFRPLNNLYVPKEDDTLDNILSQSNSYYKK